MRSLPEHAQADQEGLIGHTTVKWTAHDTTRCVLIDRTLVSHTTFQRWEWRTHVADDQFLDSSVGPLVWV